MENQPLVSIIVITYNSAKYIIETLESIYNQTYKNIELIISDDCSTDKTIDLCKEWIKQNEKRFVNTQIIIPLYNTGISANCNRGYKAAKGKWIKGIAGDDLLLPNCIADNIKYINIHQGDIIFSKTRYLFSNTNLKGIYVSPFDYKILYLSQKELLYRLSLGNALPASSSFIKKESFTDLNGYEESIPMMEDWPFWIKAILHKKQILFLNIETTVYRIHETNVSQTSNKSLRYIESEKLAKDYILSLLKRKHFLLWFYLKIRKLSDNQNQYLKLLQLINPAFYYLKYIKLKIKFMQ